MNKNKYNYKIINKFIKINLVELQIGIIGKKDIFYFKNKKLNIFLNIYNCTIIA